MSFFKKYWYLLLVTILTVVIGVVAYLTSTQLENKQSVAPTVPQVTPKAVNTQKCQLVFSIATNTPTTGPSQTPTQGPSPTPTPGPSATPGPSPTPTPTGTSNNSIPNCTGLTLSPSSGTPPFTTTITCSGTDVDGDITAVEFTLPDGTTKLVEKNVGSPGSLSTQYTLSQNGTYSFSCRVRDNNFAFSSVPDVCKQTITLGPTPTPGPSPTPSAIPTPKIPVAGGPTVLGASTIAGGFLLLLLGLAL
jgi:hypothetical protein